MDQMRAAYREWKSGGGEFANDGSLMDVSIRSGGASDAMDAPLPRIPGLPYDAEIRSAGGRGGSGSRRGQAQPQAL